MLLQDKVAIVTGSGRGIGFEIGKKFLEHGAKLVISDISEELLADAKSKLDSLGQVYTVQCDVTDATSVLDLINKTNDHFGSVDVLVNNAGVTKDGLILRMKEADWDFVIKVNLKGAFLATQAAVKVMAKQRSGRIINISSVVGLMGNAGQANYSASKAGLIGLTKSTAREFAARGVTVNAIAPGYIATDMTANLPEKAIESFMGSIPLKRAGTPDDIANTAIFLASDLSSYITGQVVQVDGGMLM